MKSKDSLNSEFGAPGPISPSSANSNGVLHSIAAVLAHKHVGEELPNLKVGKGKENSDPLCVVHIMAHGLHFLV